MSVSYGGDSIVFADGSVNSSGFIGHRNRIINGAMVIDQRNAGAATTNTISGYNIDRFQIVQTVTGKLIAQQNAGSVTPPTGFIKYQGITSQSAYTVLAGDYYLIQQAVEGTNIADLAWGTASAATVTLSFWVRSSLTGTFGGSLRNSASSRCYPFSYTISSANTWEQKTITVAGDTTGTWVTDSTAAGIWVLFGLGVGSTYGTGTANAWTSSSVFVPTGSTSVVGTNGATFYITGVQLERGSTASSFEYRPYGTELALCQRYFISYGGTTGYERFAVGLCNNTTNASVCVFLPVPMRTTPSLSYSAIAHFGAYDGGNVTVLSSLSFDQPSNIVVTFNATVASGLTQYRPAQLVANNSTAARILLSAEL